MEFINIGLIYIREWVGGVWGGVGGRGMGWGGWEGYGVGWVVAKAKTKKQDGQLEFKENGNGSGNGKREWELVKIVTIHRILY